MLDIKLIRKEPQRIEQLLRTKEADIELSSLLALDEHIRQLKQEAEELKARRNIESKKIGEMKRRGEDTAALMAEVSKWGDRISALDHELRDAEERFLQQLAALPNLPMESVKVSLDKEDNVLIKEWGAKPTFNFAFKNHVELNDLLRLFDFKRGAKLSGSGWPTYRGMGARLEWALLQYMMEIHIKNGFEQWMVPHCVRPETMFGVGQLPKFEHQLFKIRDDDYHLYLIPTAEAALNGLFLDEILMEEELPKKFVCYSPCFRREAGAAGSQERGLIRVHQFNKVEMFCFVKPQESMKVFEEMMASAEEILQGLGLHYRNMLLVTGDMSFASAYTIDIEVWLPGQNRYYEVSSVSNCTDYQARRSHIRFKKGEEKTELVHTLNGSGLATSRLMVALLENNQQEDGSVLIPPILQKYLGGVQTLKPV